MFGECVKVNKIASIFVVWVTGGVQPGHTDALSEPSGPTGLHHLPEFNFCSSER